MKSNPYLVLVLVALSVLAFAGNSLLTRAALAKPSISAEAFMLVRLGAGAMFLALVSALKNGAWKPSLLAWPGSWPGVLALAGYMVGFTLAYQSLGAATGALVLFGSVQLSMFLAGVFSGQAPGKLECLGAIIALIGLTLLLKDGLQFGAAWALASMVIAGICWGVYTLLGRGAKDPLDLTARNFLGASLLALAFWLIRLAVGQSSAVSASLEGLSLAIGSGVICSGLGYAIWYMVLPFLSRATAGVSQLLVPPVAAFMATVGLGESLGGGFYASLGLIVFGVILTITAKK